MNSNTFELTGRVNYIDAKTSNSGMAITRVLIGKKGRKEGEFETYAVTFFNDAAETLPNNIKKGDYINIIGRLGYRKYTDKDGKNHESIELYGNEYTKAVYDEATRGYIAVGANPFD